MLLFCYHIYMVVSRMEKIDELIKNQLSLEIRRLFPDQFFSVTQVRASKDLSYAKVWISAVDQLEEVVKLCQQNSNLIRRNLAKTIELRKMPQLHFVADKTEMEADKIEKLIKEIKE